MTQTDTQQAFDLVEALRLAIGRAKAANAVKGMQKRDVDSMVQGEQNADIEKRQAGTTESVANLIAAFEWGISQAKSQDAGHVPGNTEKKALLERSFDGEGVLDARSDAFAEIMRMALANKKIDDDAAAAAGEATTTLQAAAVEKRDVDGADLANLVDALQTAVASMGGSVASRDDTEGNLAKRDDAGGAELEKLVQALRVAVAQTSSGAAAGGQEEGVQKRDEGEVATADSPTFTIAQLWGIYRSLKEKGLVSS